MPGRAAAVAARGTAATELATAAAATTTGTHERRGAAQNVRSATAAGTADVAAPVSAVAAAAEASGATRDVRGRRAMPTDDDRQGLAGRHRHRGDSLTAGLDGSYEDPPVPPFAPMAVTVSEQTPAGTTKSSFAPVALNGWAVGAALVLAATATTPPAAIADAARTRTRMSGDRAKETPQAQEHSRNVAP